VTLAVDEQPFKLPVTVYKVELDIVTKGLEMLALLNPIEGDHE
jgi:hypothetical protein